LSLDANFWRGRRVLVTGHTGFKGAWLTLWLNVLGARVSALALPPEDTPNLYGLLGLDLEREVLDDLRAAEPIADLVATAQPEVVFHLAAQSLVRRSYVAPSETFATNVVGTANLLDAVRKARATRAVIVTTTDKVYENLEQGRPFVESDPLGGHDPYSTSKACTELVVASYRRSFFAPAGRPRVATVRSGNVIGGGDWSADRVVPDIVRAAADGQPVRLRYPHARRPWQHVLEPLAGYLMMAQAMATRPGFASETLNFAPDPQQAKTVAELVEACTAAFGGRPGWVQEPGDHLHEAQLLALSAENAQAVLGWRPLLKFHEAVAWTADWYDAHRTKAEVRDVSLEQIAAYDALLQHDEASRQSLVEKAHSRP